MMDSPEDAPGRSRRTGTKDPRTSRRRALTILYQADLRGREPRDLLEALRDDPAGVALLADVDEATSMDTREIDGYAARLVAGVAEHRGHLDELIGRFSRRWTVARMPVIDRNVLRLGAFELLHEPALAPAVVIHEALELVKALSTDHSARFVNGVLEAIRRTEGRDADQPQDRPR